MSPCAPRTAGAAGGVLIRFFVDDQGASPLSTLCRPAIRRGSHLAAALCRGEISTRLQSERSYLRSKVPDGVSHLFPCTAGALFPEANNLLLPLPVTPARAFFTMGAAHSSLRAQASSSFRSQVRSS